VGGQVIDVAKKADGAATLPQVQISVDRSFPRSSELGFWIFIYNAQAGGTAGPDLTAQLEVTRNGRSVVAVGPRKLTTQGMNDLARIPYGGKFPLASLTPGIYDLSVTITDKLAHTSARQNVNFRVR
jgi:hypothetical protein